MADKKMRGRRLTDAKSAFTTADILIYMDGDLNDPIIVDMIPPSVEKGRELKKEYRQKLKEFGVGKDGKLPDGKIDELMDMMSELNVRIVRACLPEGSVYNELTDEELTHGINRSGGDSSPMVLFALRSFGIHIPTNRMDFK